MSFEQDVEAAKASGLPFRVEHTFGAESSVVYLSQEEVDAAQLRTAAEAAYNSLDNRAIRAIDSTDRLQYEHLFELENRIRVLESRPTVTAAQYRQALINRWKELNG